MRLKNDVKLKNKFKNWNLQKKYLKNCLKKISFIPKKVGNIIIYRIYLQIINIIKVHFLCVFLTRPVF